MALALGLLIAALLMWSGVDRIQSLIGYLREVDRAAGFTETTATLREVEVKKVADDDGWRHELSVAYAYEVQGVEHLGRQVELVDHPALAIGWAKRVGARLQEAQSAAQPVPCFVDPFNPDRAVLDRRLRYAVVAARLAAATFLLTAGIALVAGLASWSRRARDRERRQAEHPTQPWLWRGDWADGTLTTSNRTTLLIVFVLALAWNVAVTPLVVAIHRESGAEGRWGTAGGTVAILGAVLAWAAFGQLRTWLRTGVIEFRLATLPGVIGGPLGGVVYLRSRLMPAEGLEARLSCFADKGGDDSSATVIWQDQAQIRDTLAANDPQRVGVPIYFAIPYDCEPTSRPGSGTKVHWKLDLRRGNGLPFAQFEVPVFRTADSAVDYQPDRELLEQQSLPSEGHQALDAVGIESLPTPIGWRFTGRMRCTSGTLAGLLGTWGVLVAMFAAVFLFDWHPGIAVVPGILGLVVTYALIELALWGSQLEIKGTQCTVEWGYRPWRRKRSFDPVEIRGVITDHEHSANEQQFYRLVVLARGEKLPLAKRITSRRLADGAARAVMTKIEEVRQRSDVGKVTQDVVDALPRD